MVGIQWLADTRGFSYFWSSGGGYRRWRAEEPVFGRDGDQRADIIFSFFPTVAPVSKYQPFETKELQKHTSKKNYKKMPLNPTQDFKANESLERCL